MVSLELLMLLHLLKKYLTLLFKPLRDNITNNKRFYLFLTDELFFDEILLCMCLLKNI